MQNILEITSRILCIYGLDIVITQFFSPPERSGQNECYNNDKVILPQNQFRFINASRNEI